MAGWELLLIGAWVANPTHGVAGVTGIALLVWSLFPLLNHPASTRGAWSGFSDDVAEAFRRNRVRSGLGMVGFGLFLWSASPIATMP